MKNIFKKSLGLFMALVLVLSVFTPIQSIAAPSNIEWKAEDFTYGELDDDFISLPEGKSASDYYVVKGFSDIGKQKLEANSSDSLPNLVLPEKDTEGKLVNGVDRFSFKANPGKPYISGVSFPDNYEIIGSMSFMFSGLQGELILPTNLKAMGSAVFFNNEISGELTIPEDIVIIESATFRRNKITNINFGSNLKEIERLAFAENLLEEIIIPESLETIGEQAFEENTGLDAYNQKVVLRTESGNNPNNLEDKENYLINPEPADDPGFDYSTWLEEDFSYEKGKITGFSDSGEIKIRKNKNLILPENDPDGNPITVIGIDAFRNLAKGYDIESIIFPDTIVEIEDYALQFNNLTEVKLPRDLEKLGMGVFMSNEKLTSFEFNDKIKYIGHAQFFFTKLGDVKIPASVETIEMAAFRRAGITSVVFEGNYLKKLGNFSFAGNELSNIILPEKIDEFGNQVFGNNNFTILEINNSIKDLGFQTFINNPGVEKYDGKVVIHTPDQANINELRDDLGGTYIIDPEIKADFNDKLRLKRLIEKAENLDENSLTDKFASNLQEVIENAKVIYDNKDASKASVNGMSNELDWMLNRSKLAKAMKKAEDALPDMSGENQKIMQNVYTDAAKRLMAINLTPEKEEQLTGDLNFLAALKDNEGKYNEYYGVAKVPDTHYIDSYDLKVKVWTYQGRILRVIDNGTFDDFVSTGHHDENHSEGYWIQAMGSLPQYVGLGVNTFKNTNSEDFDTISGATITSKIYELAIRDALKDWVDDSSEDNSNNWTPAKPGTNPSSTDKSKDDDNKEKNIFLRDRISGLDRILTSIELSKKTFESSSAVVIARADVFADALAASTLAYQLEAPIILSQSDNLRPEIQSEIDRLGATDIYLVGGLNSLTQDLENKLSAYQITRISGENRYETAVKIAEKINMTGKGVFIASGENFPDALSIGSYAARNGMPILLVQKDSIPGCVSDFMGSDLKTTIIGGESTISNSVENSLPNVQTRISGINRYETAVKIAEIYDPNSTMTVLASGEIFADALAASPYAARNQMPILLSQKDNLPKVVKDHINNSKISSVTIIGGTSTISEYVENEFTK